MAILSTNQRLINVGDSYSAGNGIDITNNIISVTGDNAPYSAGQNIYFDGDDNHVINGKDWSNDIEQASANAFNSASSWVAQNYANSADMTYISAMVDTKLDTSAWSSVSSDLATESYVIMANNMTYDRVTGYVESQGFATETFVNENTSGKLDSTAFTNWQNSQYATDLQTIEGQISNKYDTSSFAEASGNFYTNDNPSGFITGVDLSNYYTKDETSGKEELADAFANIPVGDPEVNAYVTSHSASIDESTNVVQSNSSTWNVVTAYQSNSSNYLTAHQDISNLMPKSESANFYPMTGNPSGFINTLPEEEEVEFEEINLSSFANSSQINDLSAAIDYVSANIGGGGTTLTGDAQGAVDNVYTNSGKYVLNDANGVYIGYSNTANTNGFAQGGGNKAEGYAIAQGLYNKANGYAIAQGQFCTASNESIAQGAGNSADNHSQAFGGHTRANNSGMAIGAYNNITTAAFVIGNGNSNTSNDCFIIDHDGNVSACGKISANGVELGAGGGGNPEVENYVQTNSANIDDTVTSYQTNSGTFLTAHQAISAEEWNDCYDNVNTNSGAWGGSALPISAGPGIKVNLVNNTLVFSNDETVLYEAPTSAGTTSVVLPESWKNFDRIKVDYYSLNDRVTFSREFQTKYQRADRIDFETYTFAADSIYWKEGQYAFTTDTNFDAVTGMWYYTDTSNQVITAAGNEIMILGMTGINRISGGN